VVEVRAATTITIEALSSNQLGTFLSSNKRQHGEAPLTHCRHCELCPQQQMGGRGEELHSLSLSSFSF